ncbi:MAG: DNA-processing protein DprA [Puniceicoccaceae bacterium]
MTNVCTADDAWIVLNGIPHLGPVTLRRLFDRFGPDPLAILGAPERDLTAVEGVGPKIAQVLRAWPEHFDLDREKTLIEKHGAGFVRQTDSAYPAPLREIYDPPIGLYTLGEMCFRDPAVAIIGSRRTTLYGLRMARRFAAGLARRGVCVVSGLARGIDAAAHEGALEAKGPTVAVLGNGADIVYPPENLDLFQRIRAEGTILSEFPFGFRANRQTFPMRNRIVAGMCRAILVVETDISGGSLITARFAGEQGRGVFAVPGRIDQATSAGCHQLIRDGATLVTSPEEILEELRLEELPLRDAGGGPGAVPAGEGAGPDALTADESTVFATLRDGDILHPDQISSSTGLPPATVNSTLMLLELRRKVRKRGDGRFEVR